MSSAFLVVLGGISALMLVLLLLVLAGSWSHRRRTRRELEAARTDVEKLHARLDALTRELEKTRREHAEAPVVPEFLITGVSTGSTTDGSTTDGSTTDGSTTDGTVVLSAAIGEPLVKLLAFGYGVRRALSAESRNRIAFEMRREVRRARKQRRREEKSALRAARAAQRDALTEGDAA